MFLATHQGQHVFTPGFKLCASYVQLFASYVQLNQSSVRLCAVLGKLPSANVPPADPLEGDVVGHPCESIHPIMISNSDSQRLRFIILEDIIGHTLAS